MCNRPGYDRIELCMFPALCDLLQRCIAVHLNFSLYCNVSPPGCKYHPGSQPLGYSLPPEPCAFPWVRHQVSLLHRCHFLCSHSSAFFLPRPLSLLHTPVLDSLRLRCHFIPTAATWFALQYSSLSLLHLRHLMYRCSTGLVGFPTIITVNLSDLLQKSSDCCVSHFQLIKNGGRSGYYHIASDINLTIVKYILASYLAVHTNRDSGG